MNPVSSQESPAGQGDAVAPLLDEAWRTDRLLASAQRVAQIGSWEYDIPADRLWWCDTTCRIFGVPPGRAVRRMADFLALVEPGDQERLAQAREQAPQRGGLLEMEYRIRRPDGEQRLLQARGEEFRDAQGRPVRRLGVVLDVTQQRQAERELRRSAALLDLASHIAQLGAWSVELPSLRPTLSPQTRQLLGLDETGVESLSQQLARGFGARWPQLQAALRACADQGVAFDLELPLDAADGARRWLRVVGQAEHTRGGRIARVNGALQDVTAQQRARQALHEADQARVARAAAEAANRAKSEFLSHMSHELRTPLNAVLGFVQLLQAGGCGAAAHRGEWLEGIRHSGERLLALIDDLLDVAQIESGSLALTLQPLDALAQAQAVLGVLRPATEAAGVTLVLDADLPEGMPWLQADEQRLRQVLLRLLGNALQAAVRGDCVTLRLRAGPTQVRFEVADAGPGLRAAQQAGLQGPPRWPDRVPTADGAGLGLALVQQLLQRMGGRLDIEGRAGMGCLRVLLPRAAAFRPSPGPPPATMAPATTVTPLPVPASASAPSSGPGGLPAGQPCGVVLYVEDNAVNALLMQELLARWPGVRVLIACDGAEGLRLARSERPALLLLDMQLPDMHGTELLRTLQADAALRALPVVAVSANVMAEDVAQARALGVRDYWPKPLDFAQVSAALRRLLPRSEASTGGL